MIYYDQSEGRKGTRLPQSIQDAGEPLMHLECLTGADLLVTPYTEKIVLQQSYNDSAASVVALLNNHKTVNEIANELELPLLSIISMKKLKIACEMGILIQRKSGQDFTSSIPKLGEIFGRMKLWTPDPWLLISANIGCNRKGKAVVDGKETGFNYKQVISAKMSWSFNGGSVIDTARDNLMSGVLDYAERKLKELQKDNIKYIVRQKWSRQHIIGPNDTRWEWMQVLMSLPSIGQKKTREIADWAGSLSESLIFLTDPEWENYPGKPDSVRPSDIKKVRALMGLEEDNRLEKIGTFGREKK